MTRLVLQHPQATADLSLFATRVARFEAQAIVRVIADGPVAALFAETPFDVLAERALALAEPLSVDVVVEAGALAARAADDDGSLELPAVLPALRWTTSMPPRSGWSPLASLAGPDVSAQVQAAVAEFRERAPDLTEGNTRREGRTVLDDLAAEIWGRELAAGVPLRLAHAAESYGFLGDDEIILRGEGQWWRLDAVYGTVLARQGLALFAL